MDEFDDLPIIELDTDDAPGPPRAPNGTPRRRVVAAVVAVVVAAGAIVAVAESHGRHPHSRTTETIVLPPAPATTPTTLDPGADFIGAMHLLTPTSGWAMNGIALFRTTDRGVSWRTITPPGVPDPIGDVDAIDFLDPAHGWAAFSAPHSPFTIWRTFDGGQTWTALHPAVCATGGCGSLHDLDFVDTRRRWALFSVDGNAGTLATTDDGGATWRVVARTPFGNTVHFVDARDGWATEVSGAVFRTADGGVTWSVVAPADPTATVIDAPAFFGSETVVVATVEEDQIPARTVVSRSSDGGTSWTTVPAPFSAGPAPDDRFTATSPSSWMVLDGPHLFVTTDAGRHWTTRTPTGGTLRAVSFVSARVGWILADAHACALTTAGCPVYLLSATVDGGRTWTLRSPTAGVTANRSP